MFRIAFDNSSAIALTARLVETVERLAPNVRLEVRPSGMIDVDRLIDNSDLDLFVGRQGETRERFASQELLATDFVVIRGGGGARGQVISADELAAIPHLHLSSTGDDIGFVDIWLRSRGLTRRIKHSVPLLGCIALLWRIDALLVVRRPIADILAVTPSITIFELPFPSPTVPICMRWHRRLDQQPAHQWLRDVIVHCVSSQCKAMTGPVCE